MNTSKYHASKGSRNKVAEFENRRGSWGVDQVLDPAMLLTPDEVAQRLKVSASWVYEKTRRRCHCPLPAFNVGRYLRFYWPHVSAWLLQQQVQRSWR